jgi:chromatin segregation and condensation protein Rec8/ScpA/Scc1 (kleisin family)
VLEVRERKTNPKKVDVNQVAAKYLAAVEKVTTAVDEALDSKLSQ